MDVFDIDLGGSNKTIIIRVKSVENRSEDFATEGVVVIFRLFAHFWHSVFSEVPREVGLGPNG